MLAFLFLFVAVAFRFLPHPLAFTPIGGALLFFGATRPRQEIWIPVLLLGASDFYLTVFHYGSAFTPDHFVTLAWYAGICLLGSLLHENRHPVRILGAALTASISFFVVSNFAVWAVWNMYPKTLAGLVQCYSAAVPFFRFQPYADLLFTAAFFGLAAISQGSALRTGSAPTSSHSQ